MNGPTGPGAIPGYRPPRRLTEPVARRARPGWNRWRCDLIGGDPDEHEGEVRSHDRGVSSGQRAVATLGVGHRSLEFRRAPDGDALLAAARAQARLDGHVGVVSIHRAHLDAEGRGEVRLGWAGATLAGALAERRQPDRSAPAATDHDPGARIVSANPFAPGTKLPTADVAAIGASVSAALADAHGLLPPLLHGALDTSTIRLDRWGRARLDGFGAAGPNPQLRPEDDVVDLLVTLGEALGDDPTAIDQRDPTETLISRLLVSVSRRRPEVIEARELHRALSALTVGYTPTAAARPNPAPTPSSSTRLRAPGTQTVVGIPPLGHVGDDLTVVLDGEYRAGPVEGLPDDLTPVRRLGRGGHGEVWLARDRVLARNVVVKRFHADATGTDDPARYPVAMAHELAALTQLAGHPASTECYGAFTDGPPSLVLSWCSEGPLDSERRWGAAELAYLGAQVADALAILHGRGLVHGDVKPHNLLRDRWDGVRLADFSLASPVGEPSARECSPRHAPPEQLEGGPLHGGVDLAALAATLFHLAEGRPPLERGDGTEALVARRLAGETEPPPMSLRALPELCEWVLAWLDPDQHARPTGGAAVAAAALRAMYQPSRLHPPLVAHSRRRVGGRLATVAGTSLLAVLGAIGLGGSDSVAARHDDDTIATTGSGAVDAGGIEVGVNEALTVALGLPPADPLSAEPAAGLTLEQGDGRSVVLKRLADPPDGVVWVLRRDDFLKTGQLVDDQPRSSGLVGPTGAITNPAPIDPVLINPGASNPVLINTGSLLHAGTQRSLVLANADGVSCVRVVTAERPPQVSPPACWDWPEGCE